MTEWLTCFGFIQKYWLNKHIYKLLCKSPAKKNSAVSAYSLRFLLVGMGGLEPQDHTVSIFIVLNYKFSNNKLWQTDAYFSDFHILS